MPAKFQVYKDAAEKFRFRLLNNEGKIVATGEAYEQHVSCLNGIKSIQKNCNSNIEDLTVENEAKIANPKYQVFKDASGGFRFHLKAANGEIIAESKSYKTKEEYKRAFDDVKNSCNAEIEDSTISSPPKKAVQKNEATPIETPKPLSAVLAKDSQIIFVGTKMPMNYVTAILTAISANNTKTVTLKARGQAVTTAVDAAEITRRRFMKNLKVASIKIGTEAMPPREGETKPRSVSTIEIQLIAE